MTDWLMVIITAIYVVATILICVFNGKSSQAAQKQIEISRNQIEEMIRQFNETNRPYIAVRFDIIRSGLMCFVIENFSSVPARNVRIKLNEDFISNIEKEDKRIRVREITESTLFLSGHQKIYILLGGQVHFNIISKVIAKFDVSYNDKYYEHTEIDLWQYRFILSYSSELEDISQHLKKIEEEDKKFHREQLKALKRDGATEVIVHFEDVNKKYETYKAVCINPGSTTEQISDYVKLSKEEVHDLLTELEYVDRFIQRVSVDENEYNDLWYRR